MFTSSSAFCCSDNFVCGSAAKLGRSVADVCIRIYKKERSKSDEEAQKWLQSVRTSRYINDFFLDISSIRFGRWGIK